MIYHEFERLQEMTDVYFKIRVFAIFGTVPMDEAIKIIYWPT